MSINIDTVHNSVPLVLEECTFQCAYSLIEEKSSMQGIPLYFQQSVVSYQFFTTMSCFIKYWYPTCTIEGEQSEKFMQYLDGVQIARLASFRVIRVGIKSGKPNFFQIDSGIKLIPAPRSAKALHLNSLNPHGMRNFPGSPSFSDNQVEGMDRHNAIFVTSSHTKKVFANMKREGKDFSEKVTPLFETMMVQALEDMGKGSEIPTDPHHTSIVLDLEEAKTSQGKEIASLKKKVKKLEQKRKSRTSGLKRLRKGRMIDNIDQDVEITLVDDTQRRMNEEDMFGVNDLDGDEVVVNVSASEKVEQSVKVIEKETLIEIKAAKPKAITTAATTVTAAGTRPKEKGIIMQEPFETPSPKPIIPSQNHHNLKINAWENAHMQAKLEEEERLARQKEEEANIALKKEENTAEGSEKAQEGTYKRAAGEKLEQEDAKRQRIEEENETAKLKRCLEIIPEDDDDNMVYYLLVEKMYLFTRNFLLRMWNDVRLQVDYEVEMACVLRLIRRQINEAYVHE
nr:hypothetical protein [Tanacetum cinerariifolium]